MHQRIKDELLSKKADKVYLFGYGSLLWKVEFEYNRKLFGYVPDFVRQFWLLSDDHRGTPDKPGRVVTLVKSTDAAVAQQKQQQQQQQSPRVYGLAYEISIDRMDQVFDYLNLREQCGYSLNTVEFYPVGCGHSDTSSMSTLTCVCYFANQDNPYYAPEQRLDELASHVHRSVGPSGTNKEYLYNLCNALRQLLAEFVRNADEIANSRNSDQHLFELEARVRALDLQK